MPRGRKRAASPVAVPGIAPAPAAAGSAAKRAKRAAPPSAPIPLAASPQNERANAQTKAALAASRRDAFKAYHTQLLWAWGADHEGWAIPHTDSSDRERILTTLSSAPGIVMPQSDKQMEKCWRRVMKPLKGAAVPTLGHEQASSASEDDDAGDGGEHGTHAPLIDPRDEELRALRQALSEKHQASRTAATVRPAAASASAPPPASGAQLQHTTCSLCYAAQVVADPTNFRCTGCGQIPHLGFAHEQNAYCRKLHAASLALASAASSGSTGQSSTTQSTVSSAPQLNKREKEFERLANERPQLRVFASQAAVSVAEALRTSRLGYAAGEYMQTPASLLRLVQSGNLMRVGHALPRTLASVDSQTDSADAVFLMQNGKMTAADSVSAPPLRSLRDFMFALCCTILPALTAQPSATADWLALARTMLELDARYGWPAANSYLEMLLSDRVHRDVSFAEYDRALIDSATRPRGQVAAAAAGSAGQSHSAKGASATGADNPISTWIPGVCRDYNLSACTRPICRFTHECGWPGCSGTDRKHPAFECHAKPVGWKRATPSIARSRGGRGGSRDGRGDSRGGGAGMGSTVASGAQ